MVHYKGRIVEILLEGYQNAAARLSCSVEAVPRPGQYLHTHNPDDELSAGPVSFFLAGEMNAAVVEPAKRGEVSISISGPISETWKPGTELLLRGPLGRGFDLPRRAQRVVLATLENKLDRLQPLIAKALRQGAEVTVFSDSDGDNLPLAVEQQGLKDLDAGVRWADYLAADVSHENVNELGTFFRSRIPAALAAEILVVAPMPCGGMAKCGICTVHTLRGPKLACEEGPVFNLKDFV